MVAAMPRFIKRSLAEKASGEFKRQQGSPKKPLRRAGGSEEMGGTWWLISLSKWVITPVIYMG